MSADQVLGAAGAGCVLLASLLIVAFATIRRLTRDVKQERDLHVAALKACVREMHEKAELQVALGEAETRLLGIDGRECARAQQDGGPS